MKTLKPKLIIGKPESGKSFSAKKIGWGFDSPLFIQGEDFIKEPLRFVAVGTDLIVIDDVPANCLSIVYRLLAGSIGGARLIVTCEMEPVEVTRELREIYDVILTSMHFTSDHEAVFHVEKELPF